MKLTKKLTAEIDQFLTTYWETYFKGDLEKWSSYLPEDYRNIGTTNEEIWNSRQEILDYTYSVFDQMIGMAEVRHRKVQIIPYKGYFMTHELGDLYVKSEDSWTLYSPIRLSSLLEKTNGKWLVLHQHGSYPDSRTTDGEAFAFDALKAENKKLQEAVEKRTKELEVKNRELAIEASLERVRARSMAMQKSEELADLSLELVKQVQELGEETWFCAFNIYDDNPQGSMEWGSNGEGTFPKYRTPREGVFLRYYEAGQRGETLLINEIGPDECPAHYEYLCALPGVGDQLLTMKAAGIPFPSSQIDHVAYFKYGYILFITYNSVPELHDIFIRFAKVFEQSYTRFLDLQKAEAQAREAQIETALEKVRGRSLAMHNSAELAEIGNEVFLQLEQLGINAEASWLWFIGQKEDEIEIWISHNYALAIKVTVNSKDYDSFAREIQAWKERVPYLKLTIPKPDAKKVIKKHFGVTLKGGKNTDLYHILQAGHEYGFLGLGSWLEPSESEVNIYMRFAKVFEQAYTRFLDLQKAEAQAREAEIETALERVRSRTMAMHKSTELGEVAAVLFEQISILSYTPDRFNIGIANEEAKTFDVWVTDQKGHQISKLFIAYADQSPIINEVFRAWQSKEKDLVQDLSGQKLVNWVRYMNEEVGIPYNKNQVKEHRCINSVFFTHGFIGITTHEAPTSETLELIGRFAKVFQQTYIRFLDLQRAEAQTKKATVEVALERVRARALAMQEPEELVEVAQVMRREMGLLGVEELETSSIYINKDNSSAAECWYALKDIRNPKKKLVADHFDLDYTDTWVGKQMLKFYQSQEEEISIPMKGERRKEWIDYCSQKSMVITGYYGQVIPERTYHLCKFSNGTIGAATPGEISTESWDLLRRAASVFSLAYSRFKDLTQARIDLIRLKEEKQRAEMALSELKSTQSQLIHAEKMASLGELTAGIAHEIQNPLNFVNNFSEVNKELMEELVEELLKGDYEEAKAIAQDIMDNDTKIIHHGKRAEGIVKGMLQHSRTSSGEKEPTDVNVLADEYLRLSYHGLRAKDKSFNADFELDLDKSLPKVNVVPQDIGRVLLNLINNAFYAVSDVEKPKVIVTTKNLGDKIQIIVSDNGSGIPENIKDKIFQPFFTTKPTGQGTGLGLSLSYDIVKAHGGGLSIETKSGQGSIFIISLPKAPEA